MRTAAASSETVEVGCDTTSFLSSPKDTFFFLRAESLRLGDVGEFKEDDAGIVGIVASPSALKTQVGAFCTADDIRLSSVRTLRGFSLQGFAPAK